MPEDRVRAGDTGHREADYDSVGGKCCLEFFQAVGTQPVEWGSTAQTIREAGEGAPLAQRWHLQHPSKCETDCAGKGARTLYRKPGRLGSDPVVPNFLCEPEPHPFHLKHNEAQNSYRNEL